MQNIFAREKLHTENRTRGKLRARNVCAQKHLCAVEVLNLCFHFYLIVIPIIIFIFRFIAISICVLILLSFILSPLSFYYNMKRCIDSYLLLTAILQQSPLQVQLPCNISIKPRVLGVYPQRLR